ncbi:hypothetical protein QJS10_CPA05g02487 [Acorus calamus]|uniref:Uncharacterized protein n=1 Tax=Acorus calamus TaxID=4465 RepID=A0AAV9ESC2_ACOCL|nr:hypothetical protein QJS10_CPA05g02487 [Acorus calamus]
MPLLEVVPELVLIGRQRLESRVGRVVERVHVLRRGGRWGRFGWGGEVNLLGRRGLRVHDEACAVVEEDVAAAVVERGELVE